MRLGHIRADGQRAVEIALGIDHVAGAAHAHPGIHQRHFRGLIQRTVARPRRTTSRPRAPCRCGTGIRRRCFECSDRPCRGDSRRIARARPSASRRSRSYTRPAVICTSGLPGSCAERALDEIARLRQFAELHVLDRQLHVGGGRHRGRGFLEALYRARMPPSQHAERPAQASSPCRGFIESPPRCVHAESASCRAAPGCDP